MRWKKTYALAWPDTTPRNITFQIIKSNHQIIKNFVFCFQNRFDNIYRRYDSCCAGQELFGLERVEYPDIPKTKKELNLLQKLYNLYNDVILKVNGYFEILWAEVNIEQINSELYDLQNRYGVAVQCSFCLVHSHPPSPTSQIRYLMKSMNNCFF